MDEIAGWLWLAVPILLFVIAYYLEKIHKNIAGIHYMLSKDFERKYLE